MSDDGVAPDPSVQSKLSDEDCVMSQMPPLPVTPSNEHCHENAVISLVVVGCSVVVVVAVVVAGVCLKSAAQNITLKTQKLHS